MDDKELIADFISELKAKISSNIKSKSKGSSGKTASKLREEVTEFRGTLFGPSYVEALEVGRGPTKKGNTGGPTLKQRIEEWVKVAKIKPRDGISDESLVFLITRKIHKEGTKLFINKGRSGIITEALTKQALDSFLKKFAEKEIVSVKTQLAVAFRDVFNA